MTGQPVSWFGVPPRGGMLQGLSINLWDADLRRPGTKLHGHRDFLLAVDYSPDGRILASGGGDDGLIKL